MYPPLYGGTARRYAADFGDLGKLALPSQGRARFEDVSADGGAGGHCTHVRVEAWAAYDERAVRTQLRGALRRPSSE